MTSVNPMMLLLGTVLVMGVIFLIGQQRARRRLKTLLAGEVELRATPDYYAWLVLSIMFIPSVILTIAGIVLGIFVDSISVPGFVYSLIWIAPPVLLLAPALGTVRADLNARHYVERIVYITLLTAALISIFTTIGILLSVLSESIKFFRQVSIVEFLTGTTWAPGAAFVESARGVESADAESRFGALPLFAGTFMITGIAMMVAVPVGLLSAIYMAEYAGKRMRRAAKPLLEILAGIPTVVYGFFAVVTVAPVVKNVANAVGLAAESEAALVPGMIMGVMIIPFMSSLCDDVITSVPQNLRAASLALGSTKSETIKRVVLPAALPGIISAFLLAISRAVGETMIVVMAAGMSPNLTANPLESMTTVTVHIVANLTGDLAFDNPQTLSAFSLGLTLLVVTLIMNVVSSFVIRKFRQRYEGD